MSPKICHFFLASIPKHIIFVCWRQRWWKGIAVSKTSLFLALIEACPKTKSRQICSGFRFQVTPKQNTKIRFWCQGKSTVLNLERDYLNNCSLTKKLNSIRTNCWVINWWLVLLQHLFVRWRSCVEVISREQTLSLVAPSPLKPCLVHWKI